MIGPIKSASDRLLTTGSGTLPDVSGALTNWFQNITVVRITKSIVNFQVVEVEDPYIFQGVVESQTSKQLQMKPEGQRSWDWKTVWCLPGSDFKIDDRVSYQGVIYRVMSQNDWSAYGYFQFEMVQDYQR